MTDVAAAKAIFEQDPRVRLLMDNGGGPQGPGSIGATWELGLRRVAAEGGAGDALLPRPAAARSAPKPGERVDGRYIADPKARPAPDAAGRRRRGRLEGAAALQLGAGRGRQGPRLHVAAADERPRDRRPVEPRRVPEVVAPGHRPPGDAHRGAPGRQRDLRAERLAARVAPQARRRSSRRRSIRSHAPQGRRRAAARGRFTLVRVPIFPVAHAFRAGSRIRVTIAATGGDRPRWDFATVDKGNDAQHDRARRRARVEARAAGGRGRDRQGHAAAGADRAARRAEPRATRPRRTAAEPPAAGRSGSGH